MNSGVRFDRWISCKNVGIARSDVARRMVNCCFCGGPSKVADCFSLAKAMIVPTVKKKSVRTVIRCLLKLDDRKLSIHCHELVLPFHPRLCLPCFSLARFCKGVAPPAKRYGSPPKFFVLVLSKLLSLTSGTDDQVSRSFGRRPLKKAPELEFKCWTDERAALDCVQEGKDLMLNR